MNINIAGLHILSADSFARVKAAVEGEGHNLVSVGESAVSALWTEAKAKFPDLVTAIQKGIADIEDKTMSGGEKAVAVALDVLETAPAAIKALPDAKDFLVHGVTDLYAEGKAALVGAAQALLGKL